MTAATLTVEEQEEEDRNSPFAEDVKPFLRGDLPGRAQLKRVLGSLFTFHDITPQRQPYVLAALGLRPLIEADDHGRVSFALDEGLLWFKSSSQ